MRTARQTRWTVSAAQSLPGAIPKHNARITPCHFRWKRPSAVWSSSACSRHTWRSLTALWMRASLGPVRCQSCGRTTAGPCGHTGGRAIAHYRVELYRGGSARLLGLRPSGVAGRAELSRGQHPARAPQAANDRDGPGHGAQKRRRHPVGGGSGETGWWPGGVGGAVSGTARLV